MPARRKPKRPYRTQHYGPAHKALRERLAPVVATGTVECARCGDVIEPGTAWQLDHNDDGRGYRGPSHATCNARAGAEKLLGLNGNGAFRDEAPYRWSRRWYEEPPVGTEVVGDGFADVHVGRGIWQTVEMARAGNRLRPSRAV
jgi:hypothetical protein